MALPQGAVYALKDPKSHKRILVYLKKGESREDAIRRAKQQHGVEEPLKESEKDSNKNGETAH